jgi:hypothetical protein
MKVSKWLGHSTFVLTLDLYGDYIPKEDGGVLNILPEPPALREAGRPAEQRCLAPVRAIAARSPVAEGAAHPGLTSLARLSSGDGSRANRAIALSSALSPTPKPLDATLRRPCEAPGP